jgi:signal transduction histidine kinase
VPLPEEQRPEPVLASLEDYESQITSRHLKVGCLLVIFLMPAGVLLDAFVYPEKLSEFWTLRYTCSLLAAALLAVLYLPIRPRFYAGIGLLIALLPVAFICWMIKETEGGASPYYAGLNLVLLAIAFVLRWSVGLSAAALAGTWLLYLAACFSNAELRASTDPGLLVNSLYFLGLTGIILLVGSRMHYRLRVRELGLTLELDQNRRRLEETNQKLIELDQVKNRFFANISHELRTPLTLLLAPLETLRQRTGPHLSAPDRELLAIMHDNGMRLLKLIGDLLDLVRLEAGRASARPECVDVDAFVRGLASNVQHTAHARQLDLRVELKHTLGWALIDREKLEKILLNLLFNALKFTPPGGHVTLRARRAGSNLEFAVTDTGIGLSHDQLSLVFNRFWQADTSASREAPGLGIGLALVKELTEVQGGSVSVESQPGQGSTFLVQLPGQPTAKPEPTTASAAKTETPSATGSPEWLLRLYRRAELFPATAAHPATSQTRPASPTDSRPVLVVADDEPQMLQFLSSQLAHDYHVVEAVNGQEAVDRTRDSHPDAVVLDMMMPLKDGLQACREIRQHTPTQTVPLILLTARADEETKLACLSAGADDFLTKPFSTTELRLRVRNLVVSHQLQGQLARQNQRLAAAIEQLKETEVQLVQMEKLASLGRLSAGIIHEINNPLNFAATNLFTLRRTVSRMPPSLKPEIDDLLNDVEIALRRVRDIVSNLRSFTHPGGGPPEDVDLPDLVDAALRFFGHELRDHIELHNHLPPGLGARADRNRLLQVLVNLLQNAVDALKSRPAAASPPSRIWITGQSAGPDVLLTIGDNGPGIDPAILDKIFDPFFTTKETGEGLGLGLSISYRIVQQAGGQLTARSEPGRFTELTLRLPTANSTPPPDSTRPTHHGELSPIHPALRR